jgi:hypothetical protein
MAKRSNLSKQLQEVSNPAKGGKRQPPVLALYLMQLRSAAPKPAIQRRRLPIAVELGADMEISEPVRIVRID